MNDIDQSFHRQGNDACSNLENIGDFTSASIDGMEREKKKQAAMRVALIMMMMMMMMI